MKNTKIIMVGEPIINNIYSGYSETAYYAGMPSRDSFSIIYETAYARDNPDSASVDNHSQNSSIRHIQKHMQLFFPLDTKNIEFPSRTFCRFQIERVTSNVLIAIIDEE